MSYPPQPGQNPDDPFAKPQPGQQPGQQQPYGQQPYGQQQYPGYPQQGGYGAPDAPMTQMPGTVKTARVLLFVFGGLNTLFGLFFLITAANADSEEVVEALGGEVEPGVMYTFAFILLASAVLAIVSGVMFGKGGKGARLLAIIAGVVLIIAGLISIPFGLLTMAAAVLIIVFAANKNGAAWFNRHQQQY